jgi:hypothetical protein
MWILRADSLMQWSRPRSERQSLRSAGIHWSGVRAGCADRPREKMSTSRTVPGGRIDKATLKVQAVARCAVGVIWKSLQAVSHSARIGASENGGSAQIRAICASRCLGETAGFAPCALWTRAAWIELKRSRGTLRQRLLAKWGLKRLTRKTLWDADHRVPVSEGGGECDLDNLRTLCLICHRRETAVLRRRRALFPPLTREAKAGPHQE